MTRTQLHTIACILALSAAWVEAGISPFSKVHTISSNPQGEPTEQVIDLTVCLETQVEYSNTSAQNYKGRYERIIEYLADGIYEMSNGANYLGSVRIFPNKRYWAACDVEWQSNDKGPTANTTGFTNNGSIFYSDFGGNVDRRDHPQAAASSLLHEAMHYIYGLGDEYGESVIKPNADRTDISFSSDLSTQAIQVIKMSEMSQLTFERLLESYAVGAKVVFFTMKDRLEIETPRLPSGLKSKPSNIQDPSQYHEISFVDRSQIKQGIFRFKLKDFTFVDVGSPSWGMVQPHNSASVPHSVSWRSQAYYVSNKHLIDDCGLEPQFQWWNFGTKHNARASSPHGLEWRDANGNTISQWDVLLQKPVNDLRFGAKPTWPRPYFPSLKHVAPKAEDVYETKTYLNYDPLTTAWTSGSTTWFEGTNCSDNKPVTLPWMKVELAGLSEAQIAAKTRTHLDVVWMEYPSVEVKVLMDLSGSMKNNNKLKQAQLAAEFAAGGFLSREETYDVSNVDVELIGFNNEVRSINYKPIRQGHSTLSEISKAIKAQTAGGTTSLWDAVSYGLSRFSANAQSLKLMYVISDGLDNTSKKSMETVVEEYRKAQVGIHTFAYGKDADRIALGKMALETGGSFYDQEETLYLKAGHAVTTVLANAYNSQQDFAGDLGPSAQTVHVLDVPNQAKRVLLFLQSQSQFDEHHVKLLTASGTELPAYSDVYPIENRTFARIEVDLTGLDATAYPLRIESPIENWYVRVVSQFDQAPNYRLETQVTPMRGIQYPEPVNFYARALNQGVLVDSAVYTIKVHRPDGSVWTRSVMPGSQPTKWVFMDYVDNGTYAWDIEAEGPGFRLVRNGQFVLNGFSSDDHGEPPLATPLVPETPVAGICNYTGDNDWFEFQELENGQSYAMHFSMVNGSEPPTVTIFGPAANIPLFHGEPIRQGESWVLSLGKDRSVNGGLIKVSGLAAGSQWELVLLKSLSTNIPIGRFEVANDWTSQHSTLSFSTFSPSEGNASLESSPGWRIIQSRNLSTSELPIISSTIALDLSIPNALANPWWTGNIEIKAIIASANATFSLGSSQQIKAIQGGWETYYFTLPEALLQRMQEPHPDLSFQIIVNGPDYLKFDNMRFTNDLYFNRVSQWEQHCPGLGCTPETPYELGPMNHQTTVVPYGDVFIRINQYPTDYTPKRVVVGVGSDDGSPLTGSMQHASGSVTLSGWYQHLVYPYQATQPILLKLNNVGGRPYRITWWADGQNP